jgi:hypothetical protein
LKKNYARYIYSRGLTTMWKGDPANPGAVYRSITLVSDAFNETAAPCQVYALEGIGKGIDKGKFAGTRGESTLYFDQDYQTLPEGYRQMKELEAKAQADGFKIMTLADIIEFEEKASRS